MALILSLAGIGAEQWSCPAAAPGAGPGKRNAMTVRMNTQMLHLLHRQAQTLRLPALDRDSPQFGCFVFALGKKQMATIRRPHKPHSIREPLLRQSEDFPRLSTGGGSDLKRMPVFKASYEGQTVGHQARGPNRVSCSPSQALNENLGSTPVQPQDRIP